MLLQVTGEPVGEVRAVSGMHERKGPHRQRLDDGGVDGVDGRRRRCSACTARR
jgi:hypothetical protein